MWQNCFQASRRYSTTTIITTTLEKTNTTTAPTTVEQSEKTTSTTRPPIKVVTEDTTPANGTVKDDKIYVRGFGWIDYEGGGGIGEVNKQMYQNEVGDLVANEEEAYYVRKVFELCVREGKGSHVLAEYLNKNGVRTHTLATYRQRGNWKRV